MILAVERRASVVTLVAARDEEVKRGAVLLEDAFRTASLPWARGARLYLVRSFDVGSIDLERGSQSLSLQLERRARTVFAAAVHAAEPNARAAQVVYFRDSHEPYVLLARRVAEGHATDAWFWPLAVRGWTEPATAGVGLRRLVVQALEREPGALVVARIVRELLERRRLDTLCRALSDTDGATLLRLSGWVDLGDSRSETASPDFPDAPAEMPHGESFAEPASVSVAGWIRQWGDDDPRTLWLSACLIVSKHPGRCAHPGLTALARGRAKALLLETESRDEAGSGGVPDGEETDSALDGARPSLVDDPLFAAENIFSSQAGETTCAGGLFFLLPVLARLDIGAFLERHPHLLDFALPGRVLDDVARRVGVPEEDPARRMLAAAFDFEDPASHPGGGFRVPSSWARGIAYHGPASSRATGAGAVSYDASGRLPLAVSAVSTEPVGELVLQSFRTALRRWCRRFAGMGLWDVVRRPARLIVTPTHLDVWLAPDEADVRIRLAGMDIDPGWIAWFGRVVLFHYGTDGTHDD